MSPRERVLAAIAHERPDRTPCDFWAEKTTMNRLFAAVGHRDEDRLLADLGVDVRMLNAVEPAECAIGGGVFQNMWGERYVYRPAEWGQMREDTHGALNEAQSMSDLESISWPTVDDMDYSRLRGTVPAIRAVRAHIRLRRHLAAAGARARLGEYVYRYGRAPGLGALALAASSRTSTCATTRGRRRSTRRTHRYVPRHKRPRHTARAAHLGGDVSRVRRAVRQARCAAQSTALGGKALFHSCGDIRAFIPDLISARRGRA